MQFIAGLLLISTFFIIACVVGCILLFRKTWLLAWLRANVGMLFLFFGLSGVIGLVLLADMEPMDGEIQYGRVEVRPFGAGSKLLRLNTERIGERDIELIDNNWRLRAISIHWTGFLPTLGLTDGVLLYDVQQSNGLGATSSTIIEHQAIVKVWEFGRLYLQWMPGVRFEYLSTDWYSNKLFTVYDLRVTKAGLTLKDLESAPKEGTAAALFQRISADEPQAKTNDAAVNDTNAGQKSGE